MDRFRSSSWLTAFGAVAVAAVLALIPASAVSPARASGTGPVTLHVEQLDAGQFVYAVFHALDRDGFCNPPDGAVSLHPVINMPVDFVIEAGEGLIIETSNRDTAPGRSKSAIPTFSSALNAASANPVRSFPPLAGGLADECQAWVKISQSIPGPLRVLVTVPGENGASTGFIADLARTTTIDVDLEFRWSLVTWPGEDGIPCGRTQRGGGCGRHYLAGDRYLRVGCDDSDLAGVLPIGSGGAGSEQPGGAEGGDGVLGGDCRPRSGAVDDRAVVVGAGFAL